MFPKKFAQKLLLSAIAVGFAINSPAQAVTYTIIDLGTLGASSFAENVNEAGQVVGSAFISGGIHHAFLYSNGTMQDLGTLDGTESFAEDVTATFVYTSQHPTTISNRTSTFVGDCRILNENP